MIVPQTIFTRASLAPLLSIWSELETNVSLAYPHPRSLDIRGDFAAIANAWKALAQDNEDMLHSVYRTKTLRQNHEAVCAKRVQETYNDCLSIYNKERHTNTVALGSLWTGSPDKVVPHPGKPLDASDSLRYALDLARFHEQYWASAQALLHYAREVLHLHDAYKTLGAVAQNIETRYFMPQHENAHRQWLTLLVIGGTAADLQLAREKLAAPYISGTYDASSLVSMPSGNHPLAEQLSHALACAVTHPRSDPTTPSSASIDLGL